MCIYPKSLVFVIFPLLCFVFVRYNKKDVTSLFYTWLKGYIWEGISYLYNNLLTSFLKEVAGRDYGCVFWDRVVKQNAEFLSQGLWVIEWRTSNKMLDR